MKATIETNEMSGFNGTAYMYECAMAYVWCAGHGWSDNKYFYLICSNTTQTRRRTHVVTKVHRNKDLSLACVYPVLRGRAI